MLFKLSYTYRTNHDKILLSIRYNKLKEVFKLKSFASVSKSRQYSEDFYPYSEQGIKLASSLFKFINYSILFIICWLIFKFLAALTDNNHFSAKELTSSFSKLSLDSLSLNINYGSLALYIAHGITTFIMWIFLILSIVYILTSCILSILYMVNIVKRQRSYERSVLPNDLRAYFLKNKIIRSKNVKDKIRAEKRKLRKKREGNDSTIEKDDKLKLEIEKEFMNMIVQVNSRESLDDKGLVDTQYRIKFYLPQDDDIAEGLDKRLNNLNSTASRLVKSRVTFGKKFMSEDKTFVIFRAWSQTKDKYIYDTSDDKEEEVFESESSYPLSVLIDRQDKIDETIIHAEQWAKRNINTVKAFLTTSEIDCSFDKFEVGNAMASYIFTLADDVKLPHFDKLGDNLDNMIKTKGSSVTLEEGKLSVSLPLPDDCKVPLNVPSMYREIFG